MTAEYTLYVWDSITGQWYTAAGSDNEHDDTIRQIMSDCDSEDTPWRLVKTQLMYHSSTMPVGW